MYKFILLLDGLLFLMLVSITMVKSTVASFYLLLGSTTDKVHLQNEAEFHQDSVKIKVNVGNK